MTLIFDCDPLVEEPTEFYYKSEFDHYIDNSSSINKWVNFITDSDSEMGKLEFLETLNEQELRDEMFVDRI